MSWIQQHRPSALHGITEADETYLLESHKGEHYLNRQPRIEGTVYVTTLMDAKTYPQKSLAKLYQQRWQIEVDFRSIKTQMGMEMLRCETAEMVKKEIAVHLLAYNLIRGQPCQGRLPQR